ncbi:MAG: hypothetical protein HXX13_14075 [Bacteroidetes bacterium]|nr:hypothetical protein [Bacteroidota bacterium]
MNINSYSYRLLGTSEPLGQLQKSVEKAFHARSFKLFWRYWNPLLGYILSKYIYKPLSKIMSDRISTILTFIFSGLILHDSWFMPLCYFVFKKPVFFPVTIIFFCFGIVSVAEDSLKLRDHIENDKVHVLINMIYIFGISIAGGLISALMYKY